MDTDEDSKSTYTDVISVHHERKKMTSAVCCLRATMIPCPQQNRFTYQKMKSNSQAKYMYKFNLSYNKQKKMGN
jgi:hypothetical protein